MNTASLLTTLPSELHYRGEPNAWVRMTRPGLRLHSFLEGLVIGPDGSYYLADVPYGRIFRIDHGTHEWSVVLQYDGEPHGLAFRSEQELFIADYRRGILSYRLGEKEPSVICDKPAGASFKGVSDITIDDDGCVWFTDPGRTSLADPTGRLFTLTHDGTVTRVLDNIPYPNGIAISHDGMHVFVAATRANAVWRLLRNSPEQPPMAGTYIQLSGGLGPDGLATNRHGELAVAHAQNGSVWVFDKLGDLIRRVRTPEGLWTTSVRFGGPDERTLFIVEAQSGSLFTFRLET